MAATILYCEPGKHPEEKNISTSVLSIKSLLDGYFQIYKFYTKEDEIILLYCRDEPGNLPFNIYFRHTPIYGKLFLTKLCSNGSLISLSSEEISELYNELVFAKNNLT